MMDSFEETIKKNMTNKELSKLSKRVTGRGTLTMDSVKLVKTDKFKNYLEKAKKIAGAKN